MAADDHLQLTILSITKSHKFLLSNKTLFLDNPEINFSSQRQISTNEDLSLETSSKNFMIRYLEKTVHNPMIDSGAINKHDSTSSSKRGVSLEIFHDYTTRSDSNDLEFPRIIKTVGDDSKSEPKHGCVINAVYNIKYDNQILNHPQVLEVFNEARLLGDKTAIGKVFERGNNPVLYDQFENDLKNEGLGFAVRKLVSNSDDSKTSTSSTLSFQDNYFNNKMISSSLDLRQLVEFLPIVKYMVKEVSYPLLSNYLPESTKNITYLAILDHKPFLFTVHLIAGHAGAMLLPQEAVNNALAVSTTGSVSCFGIRLAASHYLNEQRKDALSQDKPMDVFEVTK